VTPPDVEVTKEQIQAMEVALLESYKVMGEMDFLLYKNSNDQELVASLIKKKQQLKKDIEESKRKYENMLAAYRIQVIFLKTRL
jgi:hypothetical protein